VINILIFIVSASAFLMLKMYVWEVCLFNDLNNIHLKAERWRLYDLTLASILIILIFWFIKKCFSFFKYNLTREFKFYLIFAIFCLFFFFNFLAPPFFLYTYLLLFPVLFVGSAKVEVLLFFYINLQNNKILSTHFSCKLTWD
jgi:hypothetical protein